MIRKTTPGEVMVIQFGYWLRRGSKPSLNITPTLCSNWGGGDNFPLIVFEERDEADDSDRKSPE